MTDAAIVYGATVEKSTDGGTTYVPIPEVTSFAIPVPEKGYVDVTNLDSPNRSREHIPAMTDFSNAMIEANYTPAGYAAALADDTSNALVTYKVTMPPMAAQAAGDEFVFTAYPTVQPITGAIDEAAKMTIDLKVSGGVAFTAGA